MLYQGLYGANLHNFLEFHAGCMKKVKGIIKLRDKRENLRRREFRRELKVKRCIGGSSAGGKTLRNVLAGIPSKVKC